MDNYAGLLAGKSATVRGAAGQTAPAASNVSMIAS